MLLSIVIPTHNRSRSLTKSLAALNEHIDNISEIDICVVDDCSDSDQQERNAALCRDYDVKYQFCSKHRGPSHARNTGLFATSGEWVAFLDDDVVIAPDWYHSLQESLVNASLLEIGFEGVTRTMGSGVWDSEVENRTGGLFLTSNITYRRETLMRCGNFDEAFSGPVAEDQELAVRIQKFGKISFNSKCIVYHQPRDIALPAYIGNSFSRMKTLLDAEYYFFMKHRDRYHTVRHAATFWGTLSAILIKHWFTTCRRRTVQSLLRHPLQTTVLLLSTLLEQLTAWCMAPVYLSRYAFDSPSGRHAGVNWKKTGLLWQAKKSLPAGLFFFKRSLLRSLLFPIRRKPVYNAVPLVRRIVPFCAGQSVRLFLRVDDVFLDNKKLIERFCNAVRKTQVPFLAAITGRDLCSGEYAEQRDMITDAGGRVALHGYTHVGTYGPYAGEMLQYSFPDLDKMIARCTMGISRKYRPVAFIPPFNAIAWDQILHLSKTFPVICGGPETLRFTNNCYGPVVLDNDAVYFPSCHPFYGRAAAFIRPAVVAQVERLRCPICLTVHLQVEAEDEFASLTRCISLYREVIRDWRTLFTATVPAQLRIKGNEL